MFETFTERARHVIVLAQEEARTLERNHIGTEHVLLGLLREEEGVAAHVLGWLGITADRVRDEVVRISGNRGEELTGGQIPFTPGAKRVLELSTREASSLGHTYIGTEHILLGLIRDDVDVAMRILQSLDADAEKVYGAVMDRLSSPGARLSHRRPVRSETVAEGGLDPFWLDGLGPVLQRLADDIRETLGRAPDAGDLLLALVCAPDMLAGKAMRELDVDLDALWGALERARGEVARSRTQAIAARRQLVNEIGETGLAKQRAIEAREFDHAAELRDQERRLVEARRRSVTVTASGDEVLREVRRRLGIPETLDPREMPDPS